MVLILLLSKEYSTRRIPDIGLDLSVCAFFPSSPEAIVLSLSFLFRRQVKRPIRAGQRGRVPFAEDTQFRRKGENRSWTRDGSVSEA